jgi:hypothetical protein
LETLEDERFKKSILHEQNLDHLVAYETPAALGVAQQP